MMNSRLEIDSDDPYIGASITCIGGWFCPGIGYIMALLGTIWCH
jgi:hypothetical protein